VCVFLIKLWIVIDSKTVAGDVIVQINLNYLISNKKVY